MLINVHLHYFRQHIINAQVRKLIIRIFKPSVNMTWKLTISLACYGQYLSYDKLLVEQKSQTPKLDNILSSSITSD